MRKRERARGPGNTCRLLRPSFYKLTISQSHQIPSKEATRKEGTDSPVRRCPPCRASFHDEKQHGARALSKTVAHKIHNGEERRVLSLPPSLSQCTSAPAGLFSIPVFTFHPEKFVLELEAVVVPLLPRSDLEAVLLQNETETNRLARKLRYAVVYYQSRRFRYGIAKGRQITCFVKQLLPDGWTIRAEIFRVGSAWNPKLH